MSKIIFKGGAWSNKEDALLQAALAKYGMKNWDRVASMLENRKTPQQCKDRWYMYLDPAVNKGEWTSSEEETLLQLQELFPAQWGTIASQIKGRQAWQCEQHYHALVESAGGAANVAPDALIAELRNRRLQQGGTGGAAATFDSAFETRAPRADAADLDNKEQEMIATATARLANQDGKKQSRDSRQQQLKETTFLTTLQRGREMEASGTLSITAKRRRQSALSDMIIEQRGDNEDDEAADGFKPVEVIQSSARLIKKKSALVVAKGITSGKHGTSDDASVEAGVGAASVDLDHLFTPLSAHSLNLGAPTSGLELKLDGAPAATMSLDWSALGDVTANSISALPSAAQRSTPPSATVAPKPTVADHFEELPDVVEFDNFDEHWLNAARSLISHECDAMAGDEEAALEESLLTNAREMIQIALNSMHSAGNVVKYESSCSVVRASLLSSTSAKRERSTDLHECDLEMLASAVIDEQCRSSELRNQLYFYQHVCSKKEEAEAQRRLTVAAEKLTEAKNRESFLQAEYLRNRR